MISVRGDGARRAAVVTGLFVLGLVVNLYYGRIGFMPLDQGIVFDGAWRLMSGQVPYQDFAAPNALLPSIMQVPFFAVLGVNWFAFVLHASVINGLFCVIAFQLLRSCGATTLEATLYAALSAFFFYPPNGTPFMDQHAFFFSMLMFGAVLVAMTTASARREQAAWFLVPIFFALAYLSKQIPTAFAAVCVAVWLLLNPSRALRFIGPLMAGTAALAIAALGFQAWLGFSWSEALTYLVIMPLDVGAARTTGDGNTAALRMVFGTVRRLPAAAHRWSMYVPVAGLAAIAAGTRVIPEWRVYGWVLASVFFVTGAFLAYTINQVENSFALLMVAVGLSAVMIRRTLTGLAPVRWRAIAPAASLLVASVAVVETVDFARHVDATRTVLDTEYDPALADRAAPLLPPALSFLRWTPAGIEPEAFVALVAFLAKAEGNIVVIHDLTPLYALAGKPSVSPALWLHPGLSVPRPGSPEFDRFESDLVGRFGPADVRWLVVPSNVRTTLRGMGLRDFPRVRAVIAARGCGEREFDTVRVIALCGAPPTPGPADGQAAARRGDVSVRAGRRQGPLESLAHYSAQFDTRGGMADTVVHFLNVRHRPGVRGSPAL